MNKADIGDWISVLIGGLVFGGIIFGAIGLIIINTFRMILRRKDRVYELEAPKKKRHLRLIRGKKE